MEDSVRLRSLGVRYSEGFSHDGYPPYIEIRWPKTLPAESICVLELKKEALVGEISIKARNLSLLTCDNYLFIVITYLTGRF